MAQFNEFRLELSPDLQTPGNWLVRLANCPLPALVGPKGSLAAGFEKRHLRQLRNPNGWPNAALLQTIGKGVWKTLMAHVRADFIACQQYSAVANRGLRLCVVVVGQGAQPIGPEVLFPSELPLEALYEDTHTFLALDSRTPVSRGLQSAADREPHKVAYPLRVLLLGAAPTDKPPVDIDAETQVIERSLAPLIATGSLVLDRSIPATKDDLSRLLLARPYHALHFVGHGGFGVPDEDADSTARSHLCLQRAGSTASDPLDAASLSMLLRNSEVRLVVLTACSTSAAVPEEEPYQVSAFDGLAQRLLAGDRGVSAVVAMQLDLESDAAGHFSGAFYRHLLDPERGLDEAVGLARQSVALQMGQGHRAWVTPTVYWRCKEGRVFDLDPVLASAPDPAVLRQIAAIKTTRQIYLNFLRVATQPSMYADTGPQREEVSRNIDELDQELGRLHGDSLRLWGGRLAAGELACRLQLRLRAPARIDLIQLSVTFPPERLTFTGSMPGSAAAAAPVVVPSAGDRLQVTAVTPGAGAVWPAGEYDIALLKFTAAAPGPALILLRVADVQVHRGGAAGRFEVLDGVVVQEAPPVA